MMWTVHLALWGWIPLMLFAFANMAPRRAMLLSFVAGWLFLPAASYDLEGLPDYGKSTAACLGAFLGALLFDTARLGTFRLRFLDLPMVVWCLCPFVSSMTNGLGPYDGLSAVFEQVVVWGLPYFLGRIYLTDFGAIRELALALLIGGLVYVPLCLFEVRMSPQLNKWVYGFGGAGIEYASELGKWGSRPRVFMKDRLALGMFMTAASLVGVWIWRAGRMQSLRGMPLKWLIPLLVVTTVMCKNLGAVSLLVFGLAALFLVKRFRTGIAIWVLLAATPLYMAVRATGQWDGAQLVALVRSLHEVRADSFQTRLDNEDRLVDKALQQSVFGWGGWGRNRVYREVGAGRLQDISLTDGLWVIALGTTGIVGLVSVTGVFLLPPAVFLRRFPVAIWAHPSVAPAAVIAVLVVLYMIDNLFNDMKNPIYLVATGALVSVTALRPRMSPLVGRQSLVSPLQAGRFRNRPAVRPDVLVK